MRNFWAMMPARRPVAANIAISGRRGARRFAPIGEDEAVTDSGDLRRENEALRERISTLSAAILRISSTLDLDTALAEAVDSARRLSGARYERRHRSITYLFILVYGYASASVNCSVHNSRFDSTR